VSASPSDVLADARRLVGAPSVVVRAPGRVNLIGEHTDYNAGFVLPAAIDRSVLLALRPRADRRVHLHALTLGRTFECDVDAIAAPGEAWARYPLGVLAAFAERGLRVGGFDLVYGGDLPIGSGLSSSAAVSAGLAFGLSELSSFGLERPELAQIAQRAEHIFAGVQCGLMDPLASLLGRRGQALFIDCRELAFRYIDVPSEARLYVCDSGVTRSLAHSGYNERRRECEAGLAALRETLPEVRSLRDVTLAQLEHERGRLTPQLYKRCRYVIEENTRVQAACECLEAGDLTGLGALMSASHAGLAQLYEVSCPELDLLVAHANATPGVAGARLMGAGFGGCVLCLVPAGGDREFLASMERAYAHLSRPPRMLLCTVADGVERLI
jgi:galactokinase